MTLDNEIIFLEQQLQTEQPVLERIDALNRLSWLLRGRDWKRVKVFIDEALELSTQHQYPKGLGYSKMIRGFLHYYFEADVNKAFELFQEAQDYFTEINEIKGIAQNLTFQGLVYWGLGEYDKGFQSVNQGLKLQIQAKNLEGKAWASYMLGTFYADLQDYQNSLDYHQKALTIFEQIKDISGQCACLSGIGSICHANKDYEMSIIYHQKSLQLSEPYNLVGFQARSLNDLGMVYNSLKNIPKAIEYLMQSLEIREKINNKQGIVTSQTNLGEIFFQQNDFEIALQFLQRAEKHAFEINAKAKLMRVYKLEADLYKKIGKFQEALELFEKYMEVKSKVMGEENTTQLKNMQSVFNLEKAQKEAEIERIRNTELRLAYQQIELQTKNIIDSIKYAKRIQESILLPTFFIEDHFRDAFILYFPKDIVSGDFYWFAQKQDKLILAANDCTGHGVPGAFMVVLANGLLNQIVNEKDITDPAQILTQLDIKIKEALRQDENGSSRDGMDTAILEIDTKNNKIRFSGAKNPLYYVRNNQINVVKGAKFSIGGSQYEHRQLKEFENFEIETQENDAFYIFSDGFADQFNPEGKKYMSRNFRDFLLQISGLPMSDQKTALMNELINWKRSYTQTDDILVIGVRI